MVIRNLGGMNVTSEVDSHDIELGLLQELRITPRSLEYISILIELFLKLIKESIEFLI